MYTPQMCLQIAYQWDHWEENNVRQKERKRNRVQSSSHVLVLLVSIDMLSVIHQNHQEPL